MNVNNLFGYLNLNKMKVSRTASDARPLPDNSNRNRFTGRFSNITNGSNNSRGLIKALFIRSFSGTLELTVNRNTICLYGKGFSNYMNGPLLLNFINVRTGVNGFQINMNRPKRCRTTRLTTTRTGKNGRNIFSRRTDNNVNNINGFPIRAGITDNGSTQINNLRVIISSRPLTDIVVRARNFWVRTLRVKRPSDPSRGFICISKLHLYQDSLLAVMGTLAH